MMMIDDDDGAKICTYAYKAAFDCLYRLFLIAVTLPVTIVKFTQLCSKFPPTTLLNFACDWLALDRDISFGWLTNPSV